MTSLLHAMPRSAWLLAALLVPATGLAQDEDDRFDAHGFILVPDDGDLEDLMVTWRGEPQEAMAWSIQGVLEYANQPLVIHWMSGGEEQQAPLIEHLLALNLGGYFAPHERVAIGLSAPFYFTSITRDSLDQPAVYGPAIGDIRLDVPVNLAWLDVGEDGHFGFSAVPFGVVPSGPEARFLGATTFYGGGVVALTYDMKPVSLSLHVGAQTGRKLQYENITGGAQLLSAAGVSYRVTDTLGLRGEVRFDPSLNPSEDSPVNTAEAPLEVYASARGHAGDNLYWTAGLSTGLTSGVSAAAIRVFAGVGWAVGKDRDLDLDGDGFVDSLDACPDQVETFNGYKDDDGCPDALAKVRFKVVDPNGDPIAGAPVSWAGRDLGRTNSAGLITTSDQMPGTTVIVGASAPPKGGYEPVTMDLTPVEGDQDAQIELPWTSRLLRTIVTNPSGERVDALVAFAAGPEVMPQTQVGDDGEEAFKLIPGAWTLVFTHPDYATARREVELEPGSSEKRLEVQLEPARVQVTEGEILVLDKIFFDFDKATIRPDSMRIIDEVASTLTLNTQIKRVEVQGHTSDEGTDQYNLDLSQRRMESVVDALADRGVDRARLKPVGYGERVPLVPNDSEANREKNRRVQFVILDPAPE